MVFVFILPIIVYFFIGNYLKVLLSKNLIIPSIFFLIWIIKNILTTGCIIYPVNISCLENLNYYNSKQTLSVLYSRIRKYKDNAKNIFHRFSARKKLFNLNIYGDVAINPENKADFIFPNLCEKIRK